METHYLGRRFFQEVLKLNSFYLLERVGDGVVLYGLRSQKTHALH